MLNVVTALLLVLFVVVHAEKRVIKSHHILDHDRGQEATVPVIVWGRPRMLALEGGSTALL